MDTPDISTPTEFYVYQKILNTATDAIVMVDVNGRIIFANTALQELSGYSLSNLLNAELSLIMPDKFKNLHQGGFERYCKSKIKTRNWASIEVSVLHKKGYEIPVEISLSSFTVEQQFYVSGIIRNISYRKDKENSLIENERKFRSLIERGDDVFCLFSADGTIKYFSPGVEKILNEKSQNLKEKKLQTIIHPNDYLSFSDLLLSLKHDFSTTKKIQIRLQDKGISNRWIEMDIRNCTNDPDVNAFAGIIKDITEKKEALAGLDQFFSLSTDLFCILNTNGTILRVNPSFCTTLGYQPEELNHKKIFEFIYPEDIKTAIGAFKEKNTSQTSIKSESRLYTADGSLKWFEWNTSYNKQTDLVYTIARDVSESKRIQNDLEEKSEQYRLLFYNNPIPMYIYDTDTLKILSSNNAAIKNYGYTWEEFLDLSMLDLIPFKISDSPPKLIEQNFSTNHTENFQWQHIKKDKSIIDVELTSYPLKYKEHNARLVSAFDITSRLKTELEKQQSEANLLAILENTDEAIWSIDTNYNLMVGNTAFLNLFKDMFGFSLESVHENKNTISASTKDLLFQQFNLAMEGSRLVVERTIGSGKKKKNFEIHINPVYLDQKIIGISCFARETTERKRLEDAIQNIATGISAATGEAFFRNLVTYLSNQLHADLVILGELTDDKKWIKTLGVSHLGEAAENMEYPIINGPSELVITEGMQTFHGSLAERFPNDSLIQQLNIVSYIGIPLYNEKHECIGLLEMMSRKPLGHDKLAEYIMQIFATRAVAELERKRAEEEVRQSEANLNAVIANAQEAIWAIDKDYRLVVVNDAFKKIYAFYYNIVPEIGMRIYEYFTERAKEAWMQRFHRALGGEHFILERHYDLGEEYMDTEVSINPIIRENGQITGVAYFSRDITRRKAAEEVIRQSEEKYRTLVETMKEGVIYLNAEGVILFVNNQLCRMLGYSESELLGKTQTFFIAEPDALKNLTQNEDKKYDGTSYHYELQFIKKDGNHFWALVNGAQIITEEGNYLGAMATITDISELKKTEEDLKNINQDLNTFIYKSSHDLKGPLSSIMGLTQLANKEVKDTTALMYIDMVRQGATRLDNILTDLLDTIKIKEGILQFEEIDFNKVLEDVIQSLSHSPGFERIIFEQNILITEKFYTDKNVLRSIMQNLIDNGIKYQDFNKPNAYIWITIAPEEKGVRIEIKDNGVGIIEMAQSKIFTMFYRAHLDSKGTGLGLYIVKNAINKLGGHIGFQSKEGDGTTFILHLPNKESELPAQIEEK